MGDLAATEKKIKEIETWLERLEKTVARQPAASKAPTDDNSDDRAQDLTLLPKDKPIILPLTKKEVESGLHQPITSSLHWLAEWSIRMIKMYHDRVMYAG